MILLLNLHTLDQRIIIFHPFTTISFDLMDLFCQSFLSLIYHTFSKFYPLICSGDFRIQFRDGTFCFFEFMLQLSNFPFILSKLSFIFQLFPLKIINFNPPLLIRIFQFLNNILCFFLFPLCIFPFLSSSIKLLFHL